MPLLDEKRLSSTDQRRSGSPREPLTWFLAGFVLAALILRWMIYVVVNPVGPQLLVGYVFPSVSTMVVFPAGVGMLFAWLQVALKGPRRLVAAIALVPGLLISTLYVRAQHYAPGFDGANRATRQWLLILVVVTVLVGLTAMSWRAASDRSKVQR